MISRNSIFEEAILDLDISPTMEKNARDKYIAIANYFDKQGLESDFSPQGSFLIGTVVKPYIDGREQNYDLDVLCLLKQNKESTTPDNIKSSVGDCIKQSTTYAEKLKKEDNYCWTLQYAEVSPGVEFWMDLVPAVSEILEIKNEIVYSGVPVENSIEAVTITKKQNETYSWLTSNPIGFGRWFLEISKRHLTENMKISQRMKLKTDLSGIYAMADDIPEYFYRSNLQRAVQVLKRHRDIYYYRANKCKYKPSSIILTSMVADSVKDDFGLDIIDIVRIFITKYRKRNLSLMNGSRIENPVDKREDLSRGWCVATYETFNNWLNNIESSLIDIFEERQLKRNINSDINPRVFTEVVSDAKQVTPVKPWRSFVE